MTLRVHDSNPWRMTTHYLGLGSSILYAGALAFLCLSRLGPGALVWWAEWWGFIGGIYIMFQILAVVTRPVTNEAQEMGDIVTSPAAFFVFLILIPSIWYSRGQWPNYWEFKIWWTSLPFGVGDMLLTLAMYRISRGIARIAPTP